MVSKVLPVTLSRVAPESKRASYQHFAGESLLTKMPGELSFLQDDVVPSTQVPLEPLFLWCPPPGICFLFTMEYALILNFFIFPFYFEGWHGFKSGIADYVDVTCVANNFNK